MKQFLGKDRTTGRDRSVRILERRVCLADLDVQQSLLSFEVPLRMHGIDPDQPYHGYAVLAMNAHVYIQRLTAESEQPYG